MTQTRLDRLQDLYYGAANSDPQFQGAFAELAKRLTAAKSATGGKPSSDWVLPRGITAKQRTAIEAFAHRWALPHPWGALDLFYCCQIGLKGIQRTFRTDVGARPGPVEIVLPALHYDAVIDGTPEEWLKAQRKRLEEALTAAARSLPPANAPEAAGPRLLSPDATAMALNVFRRAALGWTWAEIANGHQGKTQFPDEAALAQNVRKWAQSAGVQLPKSKDQRPPR